MSASAGIANGSGWQAVLAEMIQGTREAVARFPVTVLFLLSAAVFASFDIEGIYPFGDGEFVPASIAGALASLAASLFGEAHRLDVRMRHGGAVLAGFFGFGLVWLEVPAATLVWALLPALCGLVLVAPFLGRGGPRAFWLFGIRLAFAAVLAGLALLLFAGGISAILASLTYLFELPVPDNLYGHVWAISGLFGAPLFGLGQIPEEFRSEPDSMAAGFMERGMRALGDFVAAPLLVVYAAILHLYAVKIVVTGTVPKGQIGWLVLAFGLCVFGALILISPFLSAARAPTRLVLRFWPLVLPVPLILLGYALFLRIGEYGVTPERYLLALFGAVAALLAVLQLFRRTRGDIRIMAALPVAAVIVASFGPQGALGVSLGSQASRFLGIVKNQPVEEDRNDEALSALSFLASHDALARVLPKGTPASVAEADNGYQTIARAWGLDPNRVGPNLRTFQPNNLSTPMAFDVAGFDLLIQAVRIGPDVGDPVSVPLPSGGEAAFSLDSDTLVIETGGRTARFPVPAEQVERLMKLDDNTPAELRLQADGRSVVLIPSYLSTDAGDPPHLRRIDAAILLKSAEWR